MEDIGLALADFVSNLENIPSEVRHLFSEITDLDERYEEAMSKASDDERSLQKELKEQANRERASEKEEALLMQIDAEHSKAKSLCQEKMRLTKKALTIVQRHLAKLDSEIRHFDKTPFDQKGSYQTGVANGSHRLPERHKKQLKLANSVLSLDGIEVDAGGGGGIEESDDQLYCFCQQVSFGDMVACDGPDCRYEWFHWECVGLTSPPKGSWYCSECLAKLLEEDED
ncbi:hypothetical protein BX070DRAFT_192877 [Coemansia spiralis]|nr:hypothetical protein BX070DRAFT_192877 [Coemansia spiralis]